MRERPATLIGAAAVQAAESLGVLAATGIVCADTISGRSYQLSSGVALTVIGFGAAAALLAVALGLAQARRWSRTPALLTQLFTGIVAIYLIQGHRYGWGVPLIAAALLGFALLLAPGTLRALGGERTSPRG
jgi:uncharacterized membrane protein